MNPRPQESPVGGRAEATPAGVPPATAGHSPPRILLAIRDADLLEATTDLLEAYDLRVATAASPYHAAESCGTSKPDVLVLDLDFPECQQGAAMEMLVAAARAHPGLAVVLLATLPPPADAFAPELRVRNYLLKPFDPGWLVRAIRMAAEDGAREREIARLRADADAAAGDARALAERLRDMQKRSHFVDLAGSLTHEIKNLLSIIKVSAHYVLKKGGEAGLDPKLAKHLQIISQQVDRSQEQILRFASLARGEEQTGGPCAVNAVARDLVSLLEYSLGSAGILVRVSLQEDLPPAAAGESAVRHILLNLLLNARDAMGQGGCITIRTTLRAARGGAPRHIEVRVEDNGPGIEAAHLQRIFEPFFTTRRKAHSTGLGLAVARQLADGFGGSLTAVSAPGEGATFTLALPPADGDAAEAPAPGGNGAEQVSPDPAPRRTGAPHSSPQRGSHEAAAQTPDRG